MRYLTTLRPANNDEIYFEMNTETCPTIATLTAIMRQYCKNDTVEFLYDEYEFQKIMNGDISLFQGHIQVDWSKIIGRVIIWTDL